MEGWKKKAEMGVGVLIIFIAMLLIAAIAAGVLITTVTSLQQKALTTGQETKAEISTYAQFVEVTGQDGSDGDLENLSILMRLAAGSDPIDLSEVLMQISLNDSTTNLRANVTSGGNATSNVFSLLYHVQGTEHRQGFLARGDLVELTLLPSRDLTAEESIRIKFVPKIGTASAVEFRAPTVISRQNTYLFP